jgi:PAS domain S-box-containing protein
LRLGQRSPPPIDNAEHSRAEFELAEQRRRLDMAVEATGLGFFDYDIRQDRSVWSPRTRELYGLGPDVELAFDEWFENHIHPDDRAGMAMAYEAGLLTPDGVFSLEHRVVTPGGTVRWLLVHCRVVRDEAGPHSMVGTVLDITQRKETEERLRLITRELGHRAKNGLAMMQAIVAQSARTASSVAELESMISGRIGAMSRAQDLITAEHRALPLIPLVKAAIEAFDGKRIVIAPSLGEAELSGTLAFSLTLLLHELATNATKYGALSNPTGKVHILRETGAPGQVVVVWRERGGPAVSAPARQGFGTRLLKIALKPHGEAITQFAPEGFEARLTFPNSFLESSSDSGG